MALFQGREAEGQGAPLKAASTRVWLSATSSIRALDLYSRVRDGGPPLTSLSSISWTVHQWGHRPASQSWCKADELGVCAQSLPWVTDV